MRKVLVMFLIVGLLAFVACSPDTSLNEELVNVTITSRDTRSLSAEASFKLADVTTWKYTAAKADNGLTTGATSTEVELKDGKTQQLSQGSWNFELYGYNKNGNLICVGEAPNTTITVEKHTISILVGPQQTTDGKGTIVIDSNISIADKDGKLFKDTENVYTKVVTVKDSTGNNVEESGFNFVKSGMYSVTVEYKAKDKDNNEYVAASAKKYFNVYDNLTTTISGTVEETTQSGEANPEAEKVVASVDGVYFDSIADAINAATAEKPLVLIKDATLEKAIDITKDTTIDLGQYKLDLKGQLSIKGSSEKSATLTLKNGFLNSSASGHDTYGIAIEANGGLKLENVEYLASSRAIKIKEHADKAALEISNSEIITDGGAMAIQTDATKTEPSGVVITIKNSHIEAKNCTEGRDISEDTTALLFNIDGTLTIKDSTLIGARQGAIVRGGKATISDSTFVSNGTTINYSDTENEKRHDYVNSNWGNGNEVPLAALVVGNRSGSYQYKTNVQLKDVELSTPNENTVRKSIYVYQNDTTNTVTVTGNIKGEYTINGDFNGAEVSDICTVMQVSNNTSTSDLFTDGSSSKKNICVNLSDGTTLTLSNGTFNEGTKSKNVTLIGKLDSSNNPVSTVDVRTNAAAEGGQLNYQRGSSFTFENLTIQAGEGNFDGIVCDELVYKNCTIKGKLTLYGKATFINCTFDNTMANQYSIWTWGGTDVTFEDCTFNTNGKAILLYGQATESKPTNLLVNNCVFNDRNNGTAGKAAIEVGNDYNATYTLTVNNATVDGFADGKNTGSKLWANKNGMDDDHLSVMIDGKKISTDDVVEYIARIGFRRFVSLDEAIKTCGEGITEIELLKDGELSINAKTEFGNEKTQKIIISGCSNSNKRNELSIKSENSDWSSINLKNDNAIFEIKNVVLKKTGYGATSGPWNNHDIYFDCNVNLTNVESLSAIALTHNSNLENIKISDKSVNEDTYMLWICENGQTVNIDDCTIDGTSEKEEIDHRAIALKNQYIKKNDAQKVTLNIKNTKISSNKYAAVLVTTYNGGNISFENVDISGTHDTTNAVWTDGNVSDLTLNGCTAKKR